MTKVILNFYQGRNIFPWLKNIIRKEIENQVNNKPADGDMNKIEKYLKQNGFETSKMKVHVYESITTENETSFEGTVDQLEGKEFSDLSVMVFNQATLESYINFE